MIDSKFETLLAVVNTLNYTQAAKVLHLTQPAVSQHISMLENEYNIKIFYRSGRDLLLTEEGKILVDYARKINSLYADVELKLLDQRYHTKSLNIGITHSSESNIFPEVLATYCSKNQGIKIRIVSDSIRNLYDKLSNYEINLAVVEDKVDTEKYSKILLDSDSLVLVMSNSHPLAKQGVIDVNDLKKEKMILRSEGSATRTLLKKHLQSLDMSLEEFNIVMEIDNIATIKDLVSKNMFVSILPKSACYTEIKNKSLSILPIENLNMIREINLVYLPESLDQTILDDLLKIYRETILIK